MNYNTIILVKAEERLTRNEYKKFEKGDALFGDGSNPKELTRWDASEEETARKELSKHKCTYDLRSFNNIGIEEYALMFCELDEDGEDAGCWSDYEFAEMIEIPENDEDEE